MNSENHSELPGAMVSVRHVSNPSAAQQVLNVIEAASPVVRSRMLTRIVVNAFESASPVVRRHLLERLLRPLGLLSLAAVAGGIFAKIRLRGNWQDMQVQIEDVQNVNAQDLVALVDHVQQVSLEAVTGVAQVIAASPLMAGSAVAAVLVTVLLRHSRGVRTDGSHDDEDGFPALPR